MKNHHESAYSPRMTNAATDTRRFDSFNLGQPHSPGLALSKSLGQ
jgi:hypothetical protein